MNWFLLFAPLLAAGALLALLIDGPEHLSIWLGIGALVFIALSLAWPTPPSAEVSLGRKLSGATAAAAILFAGIGLHSDRPLDVTSEDFTASGSASYIEEVQARLECQPNGATANTAVSWILDDAAASTVSTCLLRPRDETPVAFLQYDSPGEVEAVVTNGMVKLDRTIVEHHGSFLVDGNVLVIASEAGLSGPAYSAEYETYDIED